jgi:heme-degrading monooxygenase HmoA
VIVVANRVPVDPQRAEEFESRFRESGGGGAGTFPGFIRSEVLRPIQGETYIVLTHWESREAFDKWVQSDAFRAAHRNPAGAGVVTGHPVLEIHEVIQAHGAG